VNEGMSNPLGIGIRREHSFLFVPIPRGNFLGKEKKKHGETLEFMTIMTAIGSSIVG